MKAATRDKLIQESISVDDLVETLTSIPAAKAPETERMKVFLKDTVRSFCETENLVELFTHLNLYWSYLEVHLLEYLIKCEEYEQCLIDMRPRMAAYKDRLQLFKEQTPLSLFCQATAYEPPERPRPPPSFETMAVKFKSQPQLVTLKDVEEFRTEFARRHDLLSCAMMLQAAILGSVNIIWLVPLSIVDHIQKLLTHTEVDFFNEHHITMISLGNCCIYQEEDQLIGKVLY